MFSWLFGSKQKQPALASTPTHEASNQLSVATGDNQGPNEAITDSIDMLDFTEKNRQALMNELNSELQYWEAIQVTITKQPVHSHEVALTAKQDSLLAFIKAIFVEIEELCESPNQYLTHLINRAHPEINKLQAKINQLIADENTQNHDMLTHYVIDLIYSLQKVNNQIQNEIAYCLDFANFSALAKEKLLELTVLTVTGKDFDFNDPDAMARYRKQLFNAIADNLKQVDQIMFDARHVLANAKNYVISQPFAADSKTKASSKPSQHGFWTPDKNIRDAVNKLTEAPIKRVNSLPTFKS